MCICAKSMIRLSYEMPEGDSKVLLFCSDHVPDHWICKSTGCVQSQRIAVRILFAGHGNKSGAAGHAAQELTDDESAQTLPPVFRGDLDPLQDPFADPRIQLRDPCCGKPSVSLFPNGDPQRRIMNRVLQISLQFVRADPFCFITGVDVSRVIPNTACADLKTFGKPRLGGRLQMMNDFEIRFVLSTRDGTAKQIVADHGNMPWNRKTLSFPIREG